MVTIVASSGLKQRQLKEEMKNRRDWTLVTFFASFHVVKIFLEQQDRCHLASGHEFPGLPHRLDWKSLSPHESALWRDDNCEDPATRVISRDNLEISTEPSLSVDSVKSEW